MLVAMSSSFEPEPKRLELSTHVQPTSPSLQRMVTHNPTTTPSPQRMKTNYIPTTPKARHTIPTVDEMKTWDMDELLGWIKQRQPKLLKGDDLDNFVKACIFGIAFLAFSVDQYQSCG